MVTLEQARRVVEVVDAGLCSGKGVPVPGQMCVEAAVCYALGEDHSDKPSCVGKSVRDFKISINDRNWSSNEARAKGLRRIAVAQLGSDTLDQSAFEAMLRQKVEAVVGKSTIGCRCSQCSALKLLYYSGKTPEDKDYTAAAEIAIEVLRELNCPGVKLLDELGL